ncbi:hypothetical protein EUTSA_v10015920mg, partial [Eutrema salsugineum]
EWSDAASSVSCSSLQPVVALVCGPKHSGKSTFSRNLVQPEFTAPGFLSLTVVDKSILVPCVKTPERLHLSKSSKNKTKLPLVINTPGWVKVKINISALSKNLPAGLFWLNGNDDETAQLIEIKSPVQKLVLRTLSSDIYVFFLYSVLIQKDARLMRDTRIIAYFRQCIKGKEVNTIKDSHIPYEVPVSSLTINHLDCLIPSSEVFYSLNAFIV